MSRQLSVTLALSSYCVNWRNNKPTTSFHVELRHVEGKQKGFDEDKKMSIEVMGAPYFRILCINMHEGLGVIACFRYCFFLLLAFLLTLNNPPVVVVLLVPPDTCQTHQKRAEIRTSLAPRSTISPAFSSRRRHH